MLDENFVPDGGQQDQSQGNSFFSPGQPGGQGIHQHQFGMALVNNSLNTAHPGAGGQRYYTIQRVNGNGGNGKGDGVPGPHKHTLADSDRIKKNSVQRFVMKKDKEEKKTQVCRHQDLICLTLTRCNPASTMQRAGESLVILKSSLWNS
jgi:glutathione S-transferase